MLFLIPAQPKRSTATAVENNAAFDYVLCGEVSTFLGYLRAAKLLRDHLCLVCCSVKFGVTESAVFYSMMKNRACKMISTNGFVCRFWKIDFDIKEGFAVAISKCIFVLL